MSRKQLYFGGLAALARSDIMGDFSTQNARGATFSELHAMTFADGRRRLPDIIAGKRSYSHLESYTDADPNGPAVLDWYRTVRVSKWKAEQSLFPN